MKSTFTKLALLVLVVILSPRVFAQSVAINNTGSAPNSKAILDLTASDKGLLIPRVELNTNTDPITGTKPVGLLVYNNGGSVGSNGFYYWTGGTWAPIAASSLPSGTSGQTMRHDGSTWVANSNLYNNGSNVGIGTNSPIAVLNVHEAGESTTKTNFTQSLDDAGILITTDYTNNAYTPGVFWSTTNDNSGLPKAGIFLQENSAGSKMFLTTSTNYSQGITNDGIVIDDLGNIGLGTTSPSAQLHTTGDVRFGGLAGSGDRLMMVDNSGDVSSIAMGGSSEILMGSGVFAPLADNAIENQTSSTQNGGFRIGGNGIFNGGSVGIGTTSPSYSLHVAGTAGFDRYLYHNGDANTFVQLENDEMRFYAGGRDFLRLKESGTDELVVNESSADLDFRVKGDNDDDVFYVEGSSDRVGIGTDNPSYKLDVAGDAGFDEYIYHNGDANTYMRLMNNEMRFNAGGIDFLRLVEDDDLMVINESNIDMVFKMEGDHETDLFYVDGGSERVGIGTSNPTAKLHVDGSARIEDLGGSGTRMVVADANGNLSTQSISSGSGNWSTNGSHIYNSNSGRVGIKTSSPSYDLDVAGDAGFNEYIYHNGDNNTYFQLESDEVRIYAGGKDFIRVKESSTDELVINESSSTINFRVEGNGDQNALFVEGSTDRVGMGTNNPTAKLHVDGSVRLEDLSGSGTRMVVADNNGNLSTQTIPSGGSSGSTVSLDLHSTQYNYNVSGVSILELVPYSGDRQIRGLSGGVAGQIIYIINKDWSGSDKVTFVANTGTQQFLEHLEIDANDGAIIMYNGSNWFILSKH